MVRAEGSEVDTDYDYPPWECFRDRKGCLNRTVSQNCSPNVSKIRQSQTCGYQESIKWRASYNIPAVSNLHSNTQPTHTYSSDPSGQWCSKQTQALMRRPTHGEHDGALLSEAGNELFGELRAAPG